MLQGWENDKMMDDPKFPVTSRCKWGAVIWEDFPECVVLNLYRRKAGRGNHEWVVMIFNTEWKRMRHDVLLLDMNITRMREHVLEKELNRG